MKPLHVLLISLLTATPLTAILDSNQNTLSDLWEAAHNNQQLLDPQDPDHQPTADPDGDGWTNLEESVAGTDPFSSLSPGGMLRPDLANHPATYGDPINGIPQLITPEAISLTWPTVPGKAYQIQYSADLTPNSWSFLPETLVGSGQIITVTIPLTQNNGSPPDALFWRISVKDKDNEEDGLTAAEEHILGSSDEFADTDGDGSDDLYEAQKSTNPTDKQSGGKAITHLFESRWIYARKFDEAVTGGGGMAGIGRLSQDNSSVGSEWMPAQEQEYPAITDAEDFASLSTAASAFPLPDTWKDGLSGLWWTNILRSPDGAAPELEEFSAGRMEHRLRINKKAPTGGYPYPVQVLKLHWTRDPEPSATWTRDTFATNASIITGAVIAEGEQLSEIVQYPPITAVGVNKAVTLHSIRFEEVSPDTGFNDSVRYLPDQRTTIPVLCLANSETAQTPPNAQVKVLISPTDHPLDLELDFEGNLAATVTPNVISGTEPVVLTIELDSPLTGELPVIGSLKVEGVKALDLIAFPRRVVTLAVHKITLTNDDVEIEHTTQDKSTFQTTVAPIAIGKGLPHTVAITQGGSIFETNSAPNTDDYLGTPPAIYTGADGICQTTSASDDNQLIEAGKGKADVAIIGPGPNGEINTAPNEPGSNAQLTNGTIHNPQDDSIVDNKITVGPDGIRQTLAVIERLECVNVPNQQELQDYLDKIFGRQANIWFTITEYNEADAAYDVGSTEGAHGVFPDIAYPNRHFDFFVHQKDAQQNIALSREEQIVHTASKDNNATFNLYFLPTNIAMRIPLGGGHVNYDGMAAYARSNLRTPYVEAKEGPFAATTNQLLKTAAHEIAHSTFFGAPTGIRGLHHPWHRDSENDPIAPYEPAKNFTNLDLDTDKLRLMWYTREEGEDSVDAPAKLTHEEAWKLQTGLGPNEQQP